MSLGSRRLRLIAVLLAWIATIAVLMVWYGGDRETVVVIAAGERGSEAFEVATAIAEVAGSSNPDLQIEVYETSGSSQNAQLVQAGLADLAIVQSDAQFEGGVELVAALYFDVYQLIARNDSAIESFADLKGRRVAISATGSGQFDTFWFLAEHYDVFAGDLTALPMSSEAADFAMAQGQIDALFRVRALGNSSIEALVRDHSARVIPIEQAGALAIKRPMIRPGIVPRGSYRGEPATPAEDLPTAQSERILVASATVSERVIHELTRVMFEQRGDLVERSVAAGLIHAPDINSRLFLSLHPGARRYFDREQPGFIQENSRVLAAVLYVIAILTSAFFALRARFERRQKVRMGHLNVRLMEIADEVEASDSAAALESLRRDLVAMLRDVVADLDRDRVTHEEFEYFGFTWRAVNDMLSNRSRELQTQGGGA